jgi:hypothetical protein
MPSGSDGSRRPTMTASHRRPLDPAPSSGSIDDPVRTRHVRTASPVFGLRVVEA